MKITVRQENNVGRVIFSRVAKVDAGDVLLSTLGDVDASSPTDGDVLVYDTTSSKYVVRTIKSVDGGEF